MKKIILLLIIFNAVLFSQNYFPIEKWLKYSVKTDYDVYGPMGHHSSGTYYDTYTEIPKFIANGKQYYNIKYETGSYDFRYDSSANKLFIYLPVPDSEFLAFDFNLPLNVWDSTYISGEKTLYKCSKIDTVFLNGQNRLRKTFAVYDTRTPTFIFTQDFGLTYRYRTWGAEYPEHYSTSLFSAIIDTLLYNPIIIRFDSTNISGDRYIDMFPFALRVYGYISNVNLGSAIVAEFNIFRDDSLLNTLYFGLDKNTMTGQIGITQQMVLPGDSLTFRIKYTDNSIFMNNLTFPDSGYFHLKVLGFPSDVEQQPELPLEFFLSDAYPNPFNPTTTINYRIPVSGLITLRLYDMLGNEVATLVNEEKPPGSYNYKLSAANLQLPSGIYFYRLQARDFADTKKIILLK